MRNSPTATNLQRYTIANWQCFPFFHQWVAIGFQNQNVRLRWCKDRLLVLQFKLCWRLRRITQTNNTPLTLCSLVWSTLIILAVVPLSINKHYSSCRRCKSTNQRFSKYVNTSNHPVWTILFLPPFFCTGGVSWLRMVENWMNTLSFKHLTILSDTCYLIGQCN